MASRDSDTRMTFQTCMELVPLPSQRPPETFSGTTRRYMSARPPWVTGSDIPFPRTLRDELPMIPGAAYGGTVYSQSGLAACRALQDDSREADDATKSVAASLHTIQGCFSAVGRSDRPFVFDTTFLSAGRTFATCLVTARQPELPVNTQPDGRFLVCDRDTRLGNVVFSCICTFKRPEQAEIESQGRPPQQKFARILDSRPPLAWPPSPRLDIDAVVAEFPDVGSGTFPIVDMRKVDMTGFNTGRPPSDRRELILYRLLAPLPKEDPNAHVLVHAFEADRNGLLMAGNHVGIGHNFGAVASLSYSFYVHVNADLAVMEFGHGENDGWWIQEVSFPRAGAGRGTLMSKIWSPSGVHVATGYQDGVLRPAAKVKNPKL